MMQIVDTAVVMAITGMACMYALKYELAKLGVETTVKWWPPQKWAFLNAWLKIRQAPPGHPMLYLWGILMWVAVVLTWIMLPISMYQIVKSSM